MLKSLVMSLKARLLDLTFLITIFTIILDGLLTYIGVSYMGIACEGNPIVRYFMILMGAGTALLTLKGLSVIFILFWWKYLTKEFPRMTKIGIPLLAILYSIVVGMWVHVLIVYGIIL